MLDTIIPPRDATVRAGGDRATVAVAGALLPVFTITAGKGQAVVIQWVYASVDAAKSQIYVVLLNPSETAFAYDPTDVIFPLNEVVKSGGTAIIGIKGAAIGKTATLSWRGWVMPDPDEFYGAGKAI